MKNNVLAVIMLAAIFTSISFFQACNVSTANLSDVKLCTEKTDAGCSSDASTFPVTSAAVYCSAVLKNAPTGTKVTFEWKHDGKELGHADVESTGGSVIGNMNINGALEPGKYSVTVKLNSDNSTPITKEFTLE
ncbi:MAG: hypothetical protein J0M37_07400 [Ignavibacteria bacterium]|nr:hypothetical protein [Ignavibacteria bacterium]